MCNMTTVHCNISVKTKMYGSMRQIKYISKNGYFLFIKSILLSLNILSTVRCSAEKNSISRTKINDKS